MLQLDVNRNLPSVNVFNLRSHEWTEENIISNINKMLLPYQNINISIKNIEIRDKKSNSNVELKKSYVKELILNFEHQEKEHEFIYEIPWLIENKFYLSGNYKFVIYQLFDRPLIINNKKEITVRTNVTTFKVSKKGKGLYEYYLTLFNNKEIPFIYILYQYYGEKELKNLLCISDKNEYDGDPENLEHGLFKLVPDAVNFFKTEKDKNNLFSLRHRKTQQDIIDDILLVTDIDIFSKNFLYKENVIEELLFGLESEYIDDTNYNLKRVRFTEQILYAFLALDFYNYAITCKYNIGKYNINSKNILKQVNHESAAAQFDFVLNPLAELSMISKITLSGYGGFKKENVPTHLRDLYPSMYGKICCVDTGDRENCGRNQQLVTDIELNKDLSFKPQSKNEIISVAVQQVPFCEHDDTTRLQMAASQQRHAVMLKEFDIPIIQSGNEQRYSKYSTFIFYAKEDGQVIYLDEDVIIVKYKSGKCESFYIGYKKLYLNFLDFYNVYYKVGQKFKKNNIIAESNFFKKGRLTIGRNLHTAVMTWHGYNYEDAIIVSERVVKDGVFNSVHYFDIDIDVPVNKILLNLNDDPENYKILPKVGDTFKKGDIIAKIKNIKSSHADVIFEPPVEKKAPEDCIITDVKLYVNQINNDIPQYRDEIKRLLNNQKKKLVNLKESLKKYLLSDEIEILLDSIDVFKTDKTKGNYTIKGEVIDGIKIKITGKFERSIEVGDKIGNRHGNKGVISKIEKIENMPLINGKHVDVIINPLGIPSRMNLGQLFELHLSKSFMDLKNNLKNMLKESNNFQQIKNKLVKYIIDYYDIIDVTKDKYIVSQIKEYLKDINEKNIDKKIDNLYLIQPPFESIKLDDLKKAMLYTNTEFKEKCYDNVTQQEIQNKIADGYMYFFKLNHIAREKLAKRGVGPYTTKTSQPLDGKNRKGGQRLGEMEVWALTSHEASVNLNEMLKTKSDSIQLRNKYISEMIFNDTTNIDDEDDPVSQSIRLLQNYLKLVGLDYNIEEGKNK